MFQSEDILTCNVEDTSARSAVDERAIRLHSPISFYDPEIIITIGRTWCEFSRENIVKSVHRWVGLLSTSYSSGKFNCSAAQKKFLKTFIYFILLK